MRSVTARPLVCAGAVVVVVTAVVVPRMVDAAEAGAVERLFVAVAFPTGLATVAARAVIVVVAGGTVVLCAPVTATVAVALAVAVLFTATRAARVGTGSGVTVAGMPGVAVGICTSTPHAASTAFPATTAAAVRNRRRVCRI